MIFTDEQYSGVHGRLVLHYAPVSKETVAKVMEAAGLLLLDMINDPEFYKKQAAMRNPEFYEKLADKARWG